jgi:hypothetical protein
VTTGAGHVAIPFLPTSLGSTDDECTQPAATTAETAIHNHTTDLVGGSKLTILILGAECS